MNRGFAVCLLAACCLLAALVVGCPKGVDDQGGPKVADGGKQAKLDLKKADVGPPPAIACDKPEHDFGSVLQGEKVEHAFVIRNTGKGVLRIKRARGG
ncbi:MAG: DUF1573 domain-containing protein [Deltaproteobacteria bacterium]|nr:DUF1573 domain-containing protein [Deltaproteobacteria bacterium]